MRRRRRRGRRWRSRPGGPGDRLRAAYRALRERFGLRALRPGQERVIRSVLAGQHTLAVMPTGSGKSLCYQLPALVFDGPTVVVSPLLALIEDQVAKLRAAGVAVARIDSTLTARERREAIARLATGGRAIVLVTPELITSPAVLSELNGLKPALLVVDEAHCVSQWGHDFRPSYLGIRAAAQVLRGPPVLALTATATPQVTDDVLAQLDIQGANVVRQSFHRPNLAFAVQTFLGEGDKLRALGRLIKRLRRPGIVYCATVRAVDELYVALRRGRIPVERYHGRMGKDEREVSQAQYMKHGRRVVMLATNAFGLGVDKPDIRYIVHYHVPGSPEAYVQEAGRAGRDGRPARCILLFTSDDVAIQEHFIDSAHPTVRQARGVVEALYAWTDEGREVTVRELATSAALAERRVRVVLSVLEALGVAREVAPGRWAGIHPRPERAQLDRAAGVFDARRISDRRRLSAMIDYVESQDCRAAVLRRYFGEGDPPSCGVCDNCRRQASHHPPQPAAEELSV